MKIPERKKSVIRLQVNKLFESQKEMEDFVKQNHPTATIRQFWPVQMLACVIEIPENKSCK